MVEFPQPLTAGRGEGKIDYKVVVNEVGENQGNEV